eukprot:TRINITY_DN11120_c0_g1_i3.p1 TRINITY_DN11120_c0_g1~~TRINITY_DN11120_c0_g1_i3.p1  ORF type:complete len:570 (+),score=92.89 TRINITY_DN11120_c0_g1_i3:101-1810(+)
MMTEMKEVHTKYKEAVQAVVVQSEYKGSPAQIASTPEDYSALTEGEIASQRQYYRERYSNLSTLLGDEDDYTKILLKTLESLQKLRELNEDGVHLLAKVIELDRLEDAKINVSSALQAFISSIQSQVSLQEEIYTYLTLNHQNDSFARRKNCEGDFKFTHPEDSKADYLEDGRGNHEVDSISEAAQSCNIIKTEHDRIKEEEVYNNLSESVLPENLQEYEVQSPPPPHPQPYVKDTDTNPMIAENLEVTFKLESSEVEEGIVDTNREPVFDDFNGMNETCLKKPSMKKKKRLNEASSGGGVKKDKTQGGRKKAKMKKETYKCEFCDHISKTRGGQEKHLASHQPKEKSHICHVCGKGYFLEHHLRLHMKSHFQPAVKEDFYCKECDKHFRIKCLYEDHMRHHTGERRYRCDVCGAGFMRNYGLKRHMIKSHTGDKMHQCDLCERRFYEKSSLQEHLRVHSGEKPFTCDICSKSFAIQRSLREHQKNHSAVRSHKCKECGKAFHKRGILKKHEQLHTGIKFLCPYCPKEFNRKDKLGEHLKRMHPDSTDHLVSDSNRISATNQHIPTIQP